MKNKLSGWIGMLGVVAAALQATVAQAEQWGEKDKLQDFVTRKDVLTNGRLIDQKGLSRVKLKDQPWSSTYWPDKMGSIAWRYTDFGDGTASYLYDMARGWDTNRSKVTNNKSVMAKEGIHKPLSELSDEILNKLSPAEKYDILMGDENYSLWKSVVKRVDQLQDLDLHALWSGVCHGWAPASLMIPRPLHGVKMQSPSGRTVTFYPDDIKALAALLWGDAFGTEGNAQNFAKVEGWQCQTGAKKNPNGRLYDPRCQDVNPAFLHLVLVNQLGLNQRGMVIDRHYRAEVQNQPTFRYEFKYYKVSDRKPKPGDYSFESAKVALFKDVARRKPSKYWDPFSNYRSRKAVALVGVEATVWYSLGNVKPDHSSWTDSEKDDKLDKLTFRYDLELDANDEIVGGEWREHDVVDAPTLAEQYKYQHPDIIWLLPPGLKALSPGDFGIMNDQWNGNGPVPKNWLEASVKAANKTYGDRVRGKQVTRFAPQPLAKVVETLIKKSRE